MALDITSTATPIASHVTASPSHLEQTITSAGSSFRVRIWRPPQVSLPDPQIPSVQDEQRFRELADTWLRDTGYLSDPVRKFLDRSHLKIIAMGEKVLPLILRELEKKSGYWFVALDAVSSENPVRPEDQVSFDATANAWLYWGRHRGLI